MLIGVAQRRLVVPGIRGVWGALLLADPDLPLRLGNGTGSTAVRAATRLLGLRHLVEAVVLSRACDDRPRRVIAGIDALHALSMLSLAALDPELRRDALLSAGSACCLVALSQAGGGGSVPGSDG